MSKINSFFKLIYVGLRNEYHHYKIKPLNALAFLTYRCTSKCKTCNIWKRNSPNLKELGREEWLKVLSRLKEGRIKSLEIFGGDALLRKDVIFDIIKFCANNGIYTHFPTNANLCDKETVRKLVHSGLYTVYLSLDDLDDSHDNIRGIHGTFSKIKDALETFISVRGERKYPRIIICTTISDMNYMNLPKIVDFAEDYQVDGIYPRLLGEFSKANIESTNIDGISPEPYFIPTDAPTHLIKENNLAEFKRILKDIKKRNYRTYIDFRPFDLAQDKTFLTGIYDLRKCHLATTLVTIDPEGKVSPCPFFLSYKIGHVEEGLDKIWGNSRHRRFIEYQQKKKLAICRNCNLRVYYPSMLETFLWRSRKALKIYS